MPQLDNMLHAQLKALQHQTWLGGAHHLLCGGHGCALAASWSAKPLLSAIPWVAAERPGLTYRTCSCCKPLPAPLLQRCLALATARCSRLAAGGGGKQTRRQGRLPPAARRPQGFNTLPVPPIGARRGSGGMKKPHDAVPPLLLPNSNVSGRSSLCPRPEACTVASRAQLPAASVFDPRLPHDLTSRGESQGS